MCLIKNFLSNINLHKNRRSALYIILITVFNFSVLIPLSASDEQAREAFSKGNC